MLRAGLAFTTTQIAASTAAIVWVSIEWIWHGKATSVGLASGMVAGLVGITPAAGHVSPMAAILIGALASLICFGAVVMKGKLKYDDSLDVFGVHGVGGMIGALCTGLFASVGTNIPGWFTEGGKPDLFLLQGIGVLTGIIYAGVGTWVIAFIVDKIWGLQVTTKEETLGLDFSQHGESALSKR